MKIIDSKSDRETQYYTEYKVVELTSVTDADIETVLNEWSRKGWNLDGVQFAMRESSKRPSMAFVMFTRSATLSDSVAPLSHEDDDDEDE